LFIFAGLLNPIKQSVMENNTAYTHTGQPRRIRTAADAHSDSTFWKTMLILTLCYLVYDNHIAPTVGQEIASEPDRASLLDQFWPERNRIQRKKAPMVEMPPGDMYNYTLAVDPGYARRYEVPDAEQERHAAACRSYIDRFAPVAIAEMRRFGIPASVTLASGLLLSDAGQHPLASKANNHFEMRCFSSKCPKGHCINHPGATHKAFYTAYASVWGSFRAHSERIAGNPKYQKLFQLPKGDYEGWARGLQADHQQRDPQHDAKIIAIITNLNLDRYDALP
jgi:flagellum-specific peptidoglycan hydrolase FlgJ